MRYAILLLILLACPAYADIAEDIERHRQKVRDFTGDNPIIILGEHLSKTEKLVVAYVEEQYPEWEQETYPESVVTPEMLVNRTVVLVGGPMQNQLYDEAKRPDSAIELEDISIGKMEFITNIDGSTYLVISDNAGYDNVRRHPEKSPLAKFVPLAWVPVAATAIGLGLLWLWKLLYKLLLKIARRKASAKIMKYIRKKELNTIYRGFKLKGVRIKYREWAAIVLGAGAFAAGVSYTYFLNTSGIFLFILLNLCINTVIYGFRELVRLTMDRVHNLHTEYIFWYIGGFLTVITGWLGNTFCLTGYTVQDRETKREAVTQFRINFYTFVLALVLAILNFFFASVVLQMAMILGISCAFLNMLPTRPFGGRLIYRKLRMKWWLTFIPLTAVYILINLIP